VAIPNNRGNPQPRVLREGQRAPSNRRNRVRIPDFAAHARSGIVLCLAFEARLEPRQCLVELLHGLRLDLGGGGLGGQALAQGRGGRDLRDAERPHFGVEVIGSKPLRRSDYGVTS